MSFYIGFVSKDLIALAADRRYRNLGKLHSEADKILQVNESMWGVYIGAKFFGEYWLDIFSHQPKCLTSTRTGLALLSKLIRLTHVYHRENMKRYSLNLEGFNNIAVAGFRKGRPFIYAMDSSKRFRPELCPGGSIYSRVARNEGEIDSYINVATQAFGELQQESIDQRKAFIRTHVSKIFKHLSEKHESISSAGDVVFITPEGSIKESFNT